MDHVAKCSRHNKVHCALKTGTALYILTLLSEMTFLNVDNPRRPWKLQTLRFKAFGDTRDLISLFYTHSLTHSLTHKHTHINVYKYVSWILKTSQRHCNMQISKSKYVIYTFFNSSCINIDNNSSIE